MEREIAVLLDAKGQITSGAEAVRILKYIRQNGEWEIGQDIELAQDFNEMNLGGSRNFYFNLINQLEDCRILVGTSIRGIMFSVFTSVDYLIMETESFDTNMLDEIYHKAIHADEIPEKIVLPTEPQPTEIEGEYYFDFLSLKRQVKTVTSRQTIIPFLEGQEFQKLTILCDHKMPWLDEELELLGLHCAEENKGNGLLLVIQHNT